MTKFDNYFMYGIDQMGGDASSMPHCGPATSGQKDTCREMYGEDSCCTRVVMTDQGSGEQQAFYRCMNEQLVDLSFSVEIDGMAIAMGCATPSGAIKMAAGSMIAAATLLGLTLF